MLTKEQAKEGIQELVNKFEEVLKNNKIKEYDEEDVKLGFILPLFEKLNWTTADFSQMKSESKVLHRKRVDHAFKVRGVTKFLVEAKKSSEEINDEAIEQAYNYGYNIGVRWVVLTNFQKFLFVDCFVKSKSQAVSLVLNYNSYAERINDLWLFNREGFLKPKTDLEEWADRYRPYLKRKEVAELIFDELINWRKKLTSNIVSHSRKNKLTQGELDEAVQTILDRLIFIRTCEDKGFENQQLRPILNKWEENKGKKIIEYLNELFRDFDKRYNSELFTPPKYTDLFIDDNVLEKIIKGLYFNSDNTAIFDFSLIDVDVLGNIYEEYLEYLLKVGKRATLKRKHQHRKDFGQFYTPTYIVDFIVKNTILEKISGKSDLKILDCACGSGSFLIKVFDTLKNYYQENNIEFIDKQILRNSIYGVDIDKKACEIANLNLIFKILKQQEKLPKLVDNIKCGNTLISGDRQELKQYFNNNLSIKKPFNWDKEFEEIMNDGGFDIIIGNPPYVFTRGKHFDKYEKKYFTEKYLKDLTSIQKGKAKQSGKLNLFSLFVMRGIQLLKNNGILGFIVPNNLLRVTTLDTSRKFILDNCKVKTIVDLSSGVFEGVTASTIIIILEKEKEKSKRENNEIKILTDIKDLTSGLYKEHTIKQSNFSENVSYLFDIYANDRILNIFKKMTKNTIPLGQLTDEIIEGIVTPKGKSKFLFNKQKNKNYKKFLEGKDVGRYNVEWRGLYILFDRDKLHRARPQKVWDAKEKILTQRIGGGKYSVIATLDDEHYYTFASINNILLKDNIDFGIKYILGLLNSKLLNVYYRIKFSNKSSLTVNVSKTFLEQLPIKKISLEKQKPIIELVNKILNLNKELVKKTDKFSTRYLKLKEQIDKINDEINKLIYDLYDISKEEKEIIKENLS